MSRLTEIYEGWKNYLFPTPEIEALAKERMAVCVTCEFLNSLNICTRCSCPTAGKARSPESICLEGKWNDNKPEVALIQNPDTPDVPMEYFSSSDEYIQFLKNNDPISPINR